MRVRVFIIWMGLLGLISLQACEQNEDVLIPGNKQPDYSGVPTIKVENYVNRLFIDLLGREATDSERIRSVVSLRSGGVETLGVCPGWPSRLFPVFKTSSR